MSAEAAPPKPAPGQRKWEAISPGSDPEDVAPE